jgi:hypothetical protein
MVLNVPITVAVARELVHLPVYENISDEAFNQRLVGLGLIKVAGLNGAIDHAAAAGVRAGRLLQIVPMLDDLSVLESEDVEADSWPEDVVLRVGEDVVAILKDPDSVDARALGDGFQQRVKARQAVSGS